MNRPYTYLIRCKPENKVYYGVKYGSKANPDTFWLDYFTSSKDVSSLIDKYGLNAFEYEIRRVFDNVESAREWERKVLRRMQVNVREDFINRNIPGPNFGFGSGTSNPAHLESVIIANRLRSEQQLKDGTHNFKTEKHAVASSVRASKRNSETNAIRNAKYGKVVVECPHCGKTGGQSGMRIWHFNNCKRRNNK
jgi:hypothetical protein